MLQIKIEKTPDGFILREHRYTAVASTAGAVLATLACVAIFFLTGHLDTIREQIGGYLMAVLMAVVVISAGYSAVSHWGRRLVLDREGCRLQGTFLKERLIPWSAVRDFGVTHKTVHSRRGHGTSHIYTLYLSPTRLAASSDGRTIHRSNRAATLQIRGADVDALFAREVLDFCEKQINQGREERDRVNLYIASDRRSDD